MAALNLMFSLAEPNSVFSLCAFGAVMLLHITYLLYTEFRLRALQAKLTAGAATGALVDEDDRWIFGQFYYNPDDRHLIVNARTGLNTTGQSGPAAGRLFMGFAALCLLGMLAIGPWMSSLDTRPVTLTATEIGADQHLRNQRDPHPTRGDHRGYAFGRTAGRPVAHKRNFDGASGVWALFLARVWRVDLCLDPTEPPVFAHIHGGENLSARLAGGGADRERLPRRWKLKFRDRACRNGRPCPPAFIPSEWAEKF